MIWKFGDGCPSLVLPKLFTSGWSCSQLTERMIRRGMSPIRLLSNGKQKVGISASLTPKENQFREKISNYDNRQLPRTSNACYREPNTLRNENKRLRLLKMKSRRGGIVLSLSPGPLG